MPVVHTYKALLPHIFLKHILNVNVIIEMYDTHMHKPVTYVLHFCALDKSPDNHTDYCQCCKKE